MATNFFSEEDPVELTMVSIISAVKSVLEFGSEEEYLKKCKENGFTVLADPKLINFTKKYLSENEPQSASLRESPSARISRSVRECDTATPY